MQIDEVNSNLRHRLAKREATLKSNCAEWAICDHSAQSSPRPWLTAYAQKYRRYRHFVRLGCRRGRQVDSQTTVVFLFILTSMLTNLIFKALSDYRSFGIACTVHKKNGDIAAIFEPRQSVTSCTDDCAEWVTLVHSAQFDFRAASLLARRCLKFEFTSSILHNLFLAVKFHTSIFLVEDSFWVTGIFKKSGDSYVYTFLLFWAPGRHIEGLLRTYF